MKVIVNKDGVRVHKHELYLLMGLRTKHLPDAGLPPQEIQGVLVKCEPKAESLTARIKQLCEACDAWVPFSRAHHHQCKKKAASSTPTSLSKRCPACDQDVLPRRKAGAGISQSRYANQRICADCGLKEALQGFFWRDNATKYGIVTNAAADDPVQSGPSEYMKAAAKLADNITEQLTEEARREMDSMLKTEGHGLPEHSDMCKYGGYCPRCGTPP